MNKVQIVLVLSGTALILILYSLPRNVVENDILKENISDSHNILIIPQEVRQRINSLKMKWKSASSLEKKRNFADSLATIYLNYQILDSGIWFVDFIKSTNPKGRELRIADLVYRAYQRSNDPVKAREIGKKAEQEIRAAMELYPSNSSLKRKLAMTLVTSENPMVGIQILREMLEENPKDTETIMNLGILSIQSGQFPKAEERFKNLLTIDSTNEEAKFYLGMSQIEQGNRAGLSIMRDLTGSSNLAIQSLATEYLEN